VPRHILIVEDNVDAAESLKELLELGGHRVEMAHTGPEGIRRARAARPEVVLCDLGLPEIDGYGVARALRADPDLAAVRLVALSGYALQDDVERARQAGFDHHLAKPPDLEALERLLRELPGGQAVG
jgi:CheY-like chemotaxis protein